MKTTSELRFEQFLNENKLTFEHIEEQQTPRPDYVVLIGGTKILFEVKEISEDKNFTMEPGKGCSRTVGDHIRSKIAEARRQVQYGARQGIPSVLLIYNNLDPMHLFGTEDHDFIDAMYGAYTLAIDRESMKAVDCFQGKDQFLQEKRNTSFSAVGHLYAFRGKLEIKLFENAFAKVKMPFDILPSCFEVKRVNITYSERV